MRFINLIYMRHLQYRVKMLFFLVMDPTFGSASTNPGAVLTPLKNKKNHGSALVIVCVVAICLKLTFYKIQWGKKPQPTSVGKIIVRILKGFDESYKERAWKGPPEAFSGYIRLIFILGESEKPLCTTIRAVSIFALIWLFTQ